MTKDDLDLLIAAAAATDEILNYTVRDDGIFVETGSTRGASGYYWNPLNDDGQAHRLMVKLYMGVSIPPYKDARADVVTFHGPLINVIEINKEGDRFAAARRGIVRVAAEIGKHKGAPKCALTTSN